MNSPRPPLAKYLAEAAGTFALVFAGTAAIVVDRLHGGLGAVGISLVFGLVVMAMIYSIGHVSGAHINPAISAAFWAAGRLPGAELWRYVAAQLGGAALGSLAVRLLFGAGVGLGETLPRGGAAQSLGMEFLLTAILAFVVMAVATDERAEGALAGLAVGATVACDALIGGPVSGASMNPARSFGPALLGAGFGSHWIYWLGPVAGALAGSALYAAVRCPGPSPRDPSAAGCC